MPANNPEDLPSMSALEIAMLEAHKAETAAVLAEIDAAVAAAPTNPCLEILEVPPVPSASKVKKGKTGPSQIDMYAQVADALNKMPVKEFKAAYFNQVPLSFKDLPPESIIGVDYSTLEPHIVAQQTKYHHYQGGPSQYFEIDFNQYPSKNPAHTYPPIQQVIPQTGTYMESWTGKHFVFHKGTTVTLYNAPPGTQLQLHTSHEDQLSYQHYEPKFKPWTAKKKVVWGTSTLDPDAPVWKDEYANPAYVNRVFEGTAPLAVQGAGSGGLVDDILGACDDGG